MLVEKRACLLECSLTFVQHARKQLPDMGKSLINPQVHLNSRAYFDAGIDATRIP